ncbi:MAG: AIPR family protein, partial [Bacteroidia bacterium]
MNLEPIINAKFKKFREQMELKNVADGVAFEQYVNLSILKSHQPDAFNGDNELFNKVNIGGFEDMGIDGIAIKINGLLIRDINEAKDLVNKFPRVEIEFIFIQSKYKSNFDKGEFNNFIDGAREFLSEKQRQPHSDEIKELIRIKEFLLSEDAVFKWSDNPSVRLYYVVMGKWHDSKHQLALAEQLKDDIGHLNTYKEPYIHFVDLTGFKSILDSNENNFEVVLNSIDTMPLTSVEGVENSCILMCTANELYKLLSTNEGIIRKSLFDDNVRDFQGDNTINTEIQKTILNEPEKFALLNNGITIVCEKYVPSNRQITIRNPQIVNGCQTSHVIFNSSGENEILNKVPLIIKVISTQNDEITNQIVRGTNRQNIVLDEAFETTKPFHKELEEFINALSPEYSRFYYERRSKQYEHNPTINQYEKLNLRIIIHSFVSMFLNQPDLSHRHESKLLDTFGNILFKDFQSKLPYFTSSLAFYELEKLFRQNKLDRSYYTFKYHLLMIFREIIAGSSPNVNNERMVDEHSQLVLKVLKDKNNTIDKFKESIDIFDTTKDEWAAKLKKNIHGIKDNYEFTKLLIKNLKTAGSTTSDMVEDEDFVYKGKIVKIIKDRFGKY